MAKLSLSITSRSANLENVAKIISNLNKMVPDIATYYGELAFEAIKTIAPYSSQSQNPRNVSKFGDVRRYREPKQSTQTIRNVDGSTRTVTTYNNTDLRFDKENKRYYYNAQPRKKTTRRIKDSIFYEKTGPKSFSIGASSSDSDSVKLIMQEYGYPYDTRSNGGEDDEEDGPSEPTGKMTGFKPYPPNPKHGKQYKTSPAFNVRGVGYIRAGLIVAARALNAPAGKSGYLAYGPVSKQEIQNFESVIEQNIGKGFERFAIEYAKQNIGKDNIGVGTKLPTYITGRHEVDISSGNLQEFTPISKFSSKFGTTFASFTVQPALTTKFGVFSNTTLQGPTSFTGREKVRDFLI